MSSLILLAACQSEAGETASGGGGAAQAAEPAGQQAVAQPASSALVVRKGSTVRSAAGQPQPAAAEEVEPSPDQPTETPAPAFVICSPLVDTPAGELATIVSDPYRPPPPGSEARHHGVDFAYFRKFDRAAIEGAGVQVVLAGQVAAAVVDSFPYGNLIIIETPGGSLPAELASRISINAGESLYVLFAHLERPPVVRLGDTVEACQALGAVGKSGNAGGAHLHMEARLGASGRRFQGMAYYKIWATEEERANYLLWRTSGSYRHFDPLILFPK